MRKKLLALLGLISSVTMFASCNFGSLLPNGKNSASESSKSSESSISSSSSSSSSSSAVCNHSYEWKHNATEHWQECADCHEVKANSKTAHSGGTATCTEQAKCTVCGTSYGELAAHSYEWKHDDAKHWKECSCGAKEEGSEVEHDYKSQQNETHHWTECECGAATEKVAHSYTIAKNDETHHWTECECGAATEKVAHSYTIAKKDDTHHWTECECGAETEKVTHSYTIAKNDEMHHWTECECGAATEKVAHAAAEGAEWKTDDTHHWKACECGAIVEKAEHAPDATKDPVITAETHAGTCVCGKPINATPHSYTVEKHDDTHHWKECSCGYKDESTKEAHVYAWKYDDTKHWKACECGAVEAGSEVEHDYKPQQNDTHHWTECECGAKTDIIEHSYEWQYDDTKHWKACECGEVEADSEATHSGGAATCQTKATCADCGQLYGELGSHAYTDWNTENAKFDYKACEHCDEIDETQAYKKKVSLINQEFLMTDSAFVLNISGVDEYAEVVSIKLGEYDLGANLTALTISDELKADTQQHGKQTIVVTVKEADGATHAINVPVKEADGATHAINVPVTLITKEISSANDFRNIQPKNEDGKKGVYGYYVLTADISDTGLSGNAWADPKWSEENGFFGTFDGQNHTISAAANGANGIFGILRGATIKNVKINDNWRSGYKNYALLAKATFNSTLENVTFTLSGGNAQPANVGDGYGWISYAEFSGNTLKNVTINDAKEGNGSLFGYKFANNTFENVVINGTYTEIGHTADVTDEDGNVTPGKSVTLEEIEQIVPTSVEKVTLAMRQDFVLDGTASTIDLGEYNEAEILSIVTSTGYNLYALTSDGATKAFKEDKQKHGEQNFVVTVEKADGSKVEITVPVTVITKEIKTMAELQTAVKYTGTNLYGYYTLANDVSCNETDYTAVNATYKWYDGNGFKGTLDGKNHKITMQGNKSNHGLFGTLNGATIKNVAIHNAWYNGWATSVFGYTAYDTTFENITISVAGSTINKPTETTKLGVIVGAETGGCTWKNVTISTTNQQYTLFHTLNKDNHADTFENVVVKNPVPVQFSDNGTPDGVTLEA